MKRKHRHEDPPIKVIADPKKLAWLKAEIDKRKFHAARGTSLKRSVHK
jgi:hypothetical protein